MGSMGSMGSSGLQGGPKESRGSRRSSPRWVQGIAIGLYRVPLSSRGLCRRGGLACRVQG